MELFTLGIGHYSEDDVKQAARALTGWKLVGDEARFVPIRHDAGTKTILGRTGAFDADGLAELLLEHPATSRRLAWRLCHEFLGEGAVDSATLDRWPRACGRTTWTSAGASRRCSARGVLRPGQPSPSRREPDRVRGGRGAGPRDVDPSPSTPVLADWCGRLGQDLFDPPNVGGWPGGRAWITTRSAIGRANFAAALVGGESVGLSTPFDPIALGRPAWPAAQPVVLRAIAARTDRPEVPLESPGPARQALIRLLASPESQRISTHIPWEVGGVNEAEFTVIHRRRTRRSSSALRSAGRRADL